MISHASAPGKAILLGEHFVVYGTGAVLCAIRMRTRVSASPRDGGIGVRSQYGEDVFSLPDELETVPPHHRPVFYISGECRRSVDVEIESDIPPGVGLGSSSACCVALAGAILGRGGAKASEMALRAERTVFAGASGADTAVCASGGIIRFEDGIAEPLRARSKITLAIASTGREHSTSDAVASVRRTRERNKDRFESLRGQVAGLVGDACDAISAGDLVSLGAHMSQNHECLRDIGVSDPAMDKIVAAAAKTSYGAKLTGAGSGGCAIALVDEANAARTLEAMRGLSGDAFTVEVDSDGLVLG